MLYKVIPNADNGVFMNSDNERVDLITAEIRFYCPPGSQCGTGLGDCGTPGTCCQAFDSEDEAIIHYNLQKIEQL